MITLTAHISRGAARILVVAALATCAVATSLSLPTTAAAVAKSSSWSAYGWPVKPFHRQHPIRGGFGDPRTMFFVPPTTQGVLTGDGSFTFHFGVDISAPDGTKVYPVVSGTVSTVHVDWVGVDTGDGRSFQYWHIQPAVAVGARVEADKTVLGTILKGQEHVHFTESDNHRVVQSASGRAPDAVRGRDEARGRRDHLPRHRPGTRPDAELPPRLHRAHRRGVRHTRDPRPGELEGHADLARAAHLASADVWRDGPSARRTSRPTSAG